jgi:hypothetical protein
MNAAAAAPNANVEDADPAGQLNKINNTAPVNRRRCLTACSLPAGSCAYRCPMLGGAA